MPAAVFSPCRQYRYVLERDLLGPLLMPQKPRVAAFIGLNPSIADESVNDPTLRRCMCFARSWGFERLRMLNMYAWRSTDPEALWDVDDPVGPENDAHLLAGTADAGVIICAWGVNAKPDREADVVRLLQSHGRVLKALKITNEGRPSHPLYLRKTLAPIPYAEVAR
jgi:hypothetical protein